MTVQELINELKTCSTDAQVFVSIPEMDMNNCQVSDLYKYQDEENNEVWIRFRGWQILEEGVKP